jgi:hypothetical protein
VFFIIPTAASIALFVVVFLAGLLTRPYLIGALILVGVAGQIFTPAFSFLWLASALLKVGIALYLAFLLKFGW